MDEIENEMKIVYDDEGHNRVIKGRILKESEFLIVIKATRDKDIVTIGKRAIVKIMKC